MHVINERGQTSGASSNTCSASQMCLLRYQITCEITLANKSMSRWDCMQYDSQSTAVSNLLKSITLCSVKFPPPPSVLKYESRRVTIWRGRILFIWLFIISISLRYEQTYFRYQETQFEVHYESSPFMKSCNSTGNYVFRTFILLPLSLCSVSIPYLRLLPLSRYRRTMAIKSRYDIWTSSAFKQSAGKYECRLTTQPSRSELIWIISPSCGDH